MSDIIFNTSLTVNAYISPGATGNAPIDGLAMQIGRGVLALFSSRLPAGPLAFPSLPNAFTITGGSMTQTQGVPTFAPAAGAQWTASLEGEHQASIDLGDGYTLQLDERNSEIVIKNAETGETTRIWGDPHVDVDGKRAFDFWGTTTFELENGTKITIDTEEWSKNPDAFLASKVTITKGDQAIVVEGLSQNDLGDLSLSMSNNGEMIDMMTRDGFVLDENASGSGWRSELTGEIATQADLNLTRPGQLYGPGSTMPSLGEISQALSTFLFFGIVDTMADAFSGRSVNLLASLQAEAA